MEQEKEKKFVVLFPGQGSQSVGMGYDSKDDETVSYFLKRADEVLNFPLSSLMFSGPEEELTLTENAQPAIFTLSYALFQVMKREFSKSGKELKNFCVSAGHSLGEYTAVSCAGAISFEDTIQIVRFRGKFMQEAVPKGEGAMVAILSNLEMIQEIIKNKENVWISNINSENQIVLSGKKSAVDAVCEEMKEKKIRFIPLKVSAPFHCPLMEKAREKLSKVMEKISENGFDFPVVSAHTLEFYTKENLKETLLYGVVAPVNFLGCIKKLHSMGFDTFVELGPGKVLSSLVKRIIPSAKAISLNSAKDVIEFAREFSVGSSR